MQRKKKILVFVDWYLPGYKAGGPIQSVANMVKSLSNEFDFHIITSDTDLNTENPYPGIISDQWVERADGSKVYYFSKTQQTFSNLKKIILKEQADVLYLNSLFSVFFTLYPLLIRKKFLPARKVVLAPRGMLGRGALNIKPYKKNTFLFAAKLIGLYKNIKWHASSELESEEIKKVFGKSARVQIALNLSATRNLSFVKRIKNKGKLKAVFISRISRKKNLESTLKLLAELPSENHVEFDIYGPVEDQDYWSNCEELIAAMPSHIQAKYRGAIPNDIVNETLSSYHLSILLTFNENFGHSIIESMASGCIVLLSENTPWKNLESQKAGWDFPLKAEDKIIAALKYACAMNQEEFDIWSKSSQQFAEKIINNKESIEQNTLLFA